MTSHLTPGQRAMLEAALTVRQHQLDSRLEGQLGGRTRAEHARDLLDTDPRDTNRREDEREVDMALTDLETRELGAVSAALRRVHDETFGHCADCGTEIPFDRLKTEPWAARCVACESAREHDPRRRG